MKRLLFAVLLAVLAALLLLASSPWQGREGLQAGAYSYGYGDGGKMTRRLSALLAGVGILLAMLAAMQAWIFAQVLIHGTVFAEPNRPWLIAEFGFAIFCLMIGVVALLYGVTQNRRHQ